MNKKLLLATSTAIALILMGFVYAAHSRLTEAASLPPYLSESAPPLQVAEPTQPSDQAQFPPRSIASAPMPRPAQPSSPTTRASIACTPNALIILQAQDVAEMQHAISTLEERGGCVVHVFPTRALIGFVPTDMAQQLIGTSGIASIHTKWVAEDDLASQKTQVQQAIYFWNRYFVNPTPPPTPDPSAPQPDPLVGDVIQVEPPLDQALHRVEPPLDQALHRCPEPDADQTSEFMAGTIAVGIIFPESMDPRTSTENWGTMLDPYDRRYQVVSKIQAGLDWWARKNPDGHLIFYYDYDGSRNFITAATQHEPISLNSISDTLWIEETLTNLGYVDSGWATKARGYLWVIRHRYNTDWAVVVFVVDSLNDQDGKFADGKFAYTLSDRFGPFLMVMTYDNGDWGIARMPMVMAHQFAHVFGAVDETCSSDYCCYSQGQWGYLGIANPYCEAKCDSDGNGTCDGDDFTPGSNCHGCQTCRYNLNSLMSMSGGRMGWDEDLAVDEYGMPQVGIRDSDGDHILDPVDTIPRVEVEPKPPDFITDTTPSYVGKAEDVPYYSPTRDDVTINKIVSVEYQLDHDGIWRPATAGDGAFDRACEDFTLTTPPLSEGPHSIVISATNSVKNRSLITSTFTDAFTVDSIAPTGSISIPSGDSVVTSTQVILALGSSDANGVTEMRLRGDAGSWGAWERFATSRIWTLPSVPGVHTIWVQFRDAAGNESAPYSESVEYQFPYRVYLPPVMRK